MTGPSRAASAALLLAASTVLAPSACRSAQPAGSLEAPEDASPPIASDVRASPGGSGASALRLAIALGDLEATRRLLDAGVDPNGKLADGSPVASWLGSGQRWSDDDLLSVARLLSQYRCRFDDRDDRRATSLLTNLAHRHAPKTLAFVASKKTAPDCADALQAIAAQDDLESIEVLLACGADPLSGRGGLRSALFDAAARGQKASVAAMLKHVPDMADPKVGAAFKVIRPGDSETAKAFVEAGFKPPPPTPSPASLRPHTLPPDIATLLRRLGLPSTGGLAGLAGPLTCWLVERCGDVVFVDCNSAADGPAYYLNQKAGKLLATCGGACMAGCTNCPPKEWTCTHAGP